MKYRRLGSTGTLVSELCLGGMTFGADTDEDEARQIIALFRDHGGTFFDTADCYHGGKSEEILGRALAGDRDEVVLATKSGLRVGDGPNDVGGSATHLIRSVERSLRRLGTDRIDLYQLHCWDPETPLEETLAAAATLVQQGKVRYFGVSNLSGWQLTKAWYLASAHGWPRPVTAQQQYSLVERSIEREVVPACTHLGVGVLPWGPLGGGFLSGKYDRDTPPPSGTRLAGSLSWMEEYWERRATERGWRILDAIRAVSDETGRTVAQVAINWLLHRPGVVSPILGARTLAQAKDNLGGYGWELTAEQSERLSVASAIEPEYVQRFLGVAMGSRVDFDPAVDAWVGLR